MAAIRSFGTKPEQRLELLLRDVFGARRKLVCRPALPGRPDFFLPGLHLAVFADGCFWHSCPQHGRMPEANRDYWGPKLRKNKARDRANRRALVAAGIRSVRIWEHDLKRDTSRARQRLVRVRREMLSSRDRTGDKAETSVA
jgi:DNA mismatch endonuclease (patch repair protein)